MNTGNNGSIKYYSIGEVSEITKVKQSVLRFWETEFKNLAPLKNKFDHRVYTLDDIAVVEKIKDLLYNKGLTIKGARNYFESSGSSERIEDDFSIKEIKAKLTEMLDILKDKE
jgi:DNA-binding transcriptional MerR regulator